MLFMSRCLHFPHSQPSPHPLSQRDWNSSRSERGACSSNCQHALGAVDILIPLPCEAGEGRGGGVKNRVATVFKTNCKHALAKNAEAASATEQSPPPWGGLGWGQQTNPWSDNKHLPNIMQKTKIRITAEPSPSLAGRSPQRGRAGEGAAIAK